MKSLKISLFCVFLLFCSSFAQIDTIDGTGDPYIGGVHLNNGSDINLFNIGLVENKILYGSQRIDGNDVMIVDLNDLLNVKLAGSINRTGSNVEEYFRLIKQENTVFFNDSNYLRIYDVTNLASPLEKHSKDIEKEIVSVNIKEDTLFIGEIGGGGFFRDFNILHYDYINSPVFLDSFNLLGGGENSFILNNKYIKFNSVSISIWNFPLSERVPDGGINLPQYGIAMAVKDNYAFISTDIGTIVYDYSNSSNFLPIDTLAGYGDDIEVYKNLLLVGDDELHIFDIGDINNIVKKAIFVGKNINFKVDSSNNYIYCLRINYDYVDIIDLTKYVKEIKTLTLTSPSSGDTYTEGQQIDITWQSVGTIANVKLSYSLNNGTDWTEIIASTPNDGNHPWTALGSSPYCKVKIEDASDGTVNAVSGTFNIGGSKINPVIDNQLSVNKGLIKIEIFDLRGRKIKTLPVNALDFSLKDMNGIYIVRLIGKNINRQFKIMVTK